MRPVIGCGLRAAGIASAAILCALSVAAAQAPAPRGESPAAPGPKGPADIIGGAGRARSARELQQATQRGQQAAPPAADPHAAGGPRAHPGVDEPQPRKPIATERPDPTLADGTIRVVVRDPAGAPARGAEVSLGVLNSDASRSSRNARTGPDGSALFSGLATGDRQAYRVNAPYQGAKYSSNPFRLPQRGGYEVVIEQLPVTRNDRLVVLYVGATSIELKDDRIHVVQQSRLLNLGDMTYVFPEAGALVKLPAGFMAVQVQEVMTDQRVVETAGAGLRVHGSLPPGEVTLLWGFDLPLAGSDASFAIGIPWPTFAYRVIADAPGGLSLSVKDMPEPVLHAEGGRRFLISEMQRRVGDAPFQLVEISLQGIPGPGPGRFIAAALALLLVIGGIVLAFRAQPANVTAVHADFGARRAELVERARALQALRQAGETGPQYHEEQIGLLTDELAALLFEEAERSRAASPRPAG